MIMMNEDELQKMVLRNKIELKISHLEKVRNRAIALWTGSLTTVLILLALGIIFASGHLALLGTLLLVPTAVGGWTHAVYSERIDTAETKL